MGYKIVVADDEPIIRMDICEMLKFAGYDVVGQASNGLEVIEKCKLYKPDLAILDIQMPNLDGLKATKIIIEENLSSAVIILSAYSGEEFIERAKEAGAIGYVVKPITEMGLLAEVGVTITRGIEIKKMKDEIQKVKEEMEKRKMLERAKGVLMSKYDYSENDAYSKIRKLSMDKRCPIQEIAEKILDGNIMVHK
jgi:two-component system, response regulator PdtaR